MAAYAGESLQKKIGRAMAYSAAIVPMPELDPMYVGDVVMLAGPNAHDAGPLGGFVGRSIPPSRWMFVDTDAAACAAARARVPEARVFHGPLHEAPISPGSIMLGVLDFCGSLEGAAMRGMAHVARNMTFGSRLIITTLKGREATGDTARAIRKMRRRESTTSRALVRSILIANDVANVIGAWTVSSAGMKPPRMAPFIHVIADVEYTATSPMLITVLCLTRYTLAVERLQSMPSRTIEIPRNTTPADALRLLHADEIGTETIARILDVSPGTIAAWRAHRTMGTYK